MTSGAIYVDDSGNPGADSGSDFLPSSRKSWTAVIVPSVVADKVRVAMDIFLGGVQLDFGADELHFTESWSGRGLWKGVAVEKRAEMINIMARLMDGFSLPVVHQTVSEQTLDDHPDFRRSLVGERAGDWKLDDISHFGLLLLCSTVSKHVREMKAAGPREFNLPFPLFVDEGLMLAGGNRKLPNWADVIAGPKACFRRSTEVPGIQLADFAAIIITRVQWAAVKRTPQPAFEQAEEVILRAAAGLNILNLPMRRTTSDKFGRDSYENWLAEDRVAKGLPRRPPGRKLGR